MQKKIMSAFVGFFSALCIAQISASVSVKMNTQLAAQESEFLKQRQAHNKQALETLLGRSLNDIQVPRIALCMSGGGYRALIATTGFLQGLHTVPDKSAFSSISTLLSTMSSFLHQYLFNLFNSDNEISEMGHSVEVGPLDVGIRLRATQSPKAVSFKTAPYPGFPTDLQAPMMAAQCVAAGSSVIEETVFENRLTHVRELQKMGASIRVEHNTAFITGVEELYGTKVIATDIRASCALVAAGLVAKGVTVMTGIHHWTRGYDSLEKKLALLGARISLRNAEECEMLPYNKGDVPVVEQLT